MRPHCFVTGGKETRLASRRSAAALAQPMPNGVDHGGNSAWATTGPLRYPDLFSRTVDGWLSGTALPPEIGLPTSLSDACRSQTAQRSISRLATGRPAAR